MPEAMTPIHHPTRRLLLITPPMVQINAPYPATAFLAGQLRARGHAVSQADLSLALAERLFSAQGLAAAETAARDSRRRRTEAVRHFLRHAAEYGATVDAVRRFLQGRDSTLAYRIVTRAFLPEGPRFEALTAEHVQAFGALGTHDLAKHLASLYLDDLADAVREGVDARFGLARHAERLAVAAARFEPLRRALEARPTLLDGWIDQETTACLALARPDIVGLTVPFPGALYGALRIARQVRRHHPRVRVVLGGGYPSTELRDVHEPRLFDYVDYVVLDEGAEPLQRIMEQDPPPGRRTLPPTRLLRTFSRPRTKVVWSPEAAPAPAAVRPTAPARHVLTVPAYEDLPLDRYLALVEMPNPMHRLWSDGCWLKLPLAHGCYWHRCRFCDTSLDYIGRYVPPDPEAVVDGLAALVARTGRTGFHFTDEALAPGLLRAVATRILERGLAVTWWGNIRFEAGFTRELADLLAASGCVAVTGGLECADDRLLACMQKGITMAGAARVCRQLAEAGILVHTYLMYGFPSQTAEDAGRALERVRRLFAGGWIHSAYWHRFALTAHSPMAADPAAYGIRLRRQPRATLARNELAFDEPGAPDWTAVGAVLRQATYNYMLGNLLDQPAAAWFADEATAGGAATP